jgi:hypothetical protein
MPHNILAYMNERMKEKREKLVTAASDPFLKYKGL